MAGGGARPTDNRETFLALLFNGRHRGERNRTYYGSDATAAVCCALPTCFSSGYSIFFFLVHTFTYETLFLLSKSERIVSY